MTKLLQFPILLLVVLLSCLLACSIAVVNAAEDCFICQETIDEQKDGKAAATEGLFNQCTPINHANQVHAECIQKWVLSSNKDTCPLCRSKLDIELLPPRPVPTDAMIDGVVSHQLEFEEMMARYQLSQMASINVVEGLIRQSELDQELTMKKIANKVRTKLVKHLVTQISISCLIHTAPSTFRSGASNYNKKTMPAECTKEFNHPLWQDDASLMDRIYDNLNTKRKMCETVDQTICVFKHIFGAGVDGGGGGGNDGETTLINHVEEEQDFLPFFDENNPFDNQFHDLN